MPCGGLPASCWGQVQPSSPFGVDGACLAVQQKLAGVDCFASVEYCSMRQAAPQLRKDCLRRACCLCWGLARLSADNSDSRTCVACLKHWPSGCMLPSAIAPARCCSLQTPH